MYNNTQRVILNYLLILKYTTWIVILSISVSLIFVVLLTHSYRTSATCRYYQSAKWYT